MRTKSETETTIMDQARVWYPVLLMLDSEIRDPEYIPIPTFPAELSVNHGNPTVWLPLAPKPEIFLSL